MTTATKNAVKVIEAKKHNVVPGFGSLESFELMQRQAKMLATSSLVPKEYQGNIANCTIAINMANRINADPLMVTQNLHVINGRPGWSAQFLIATFNSSRRFSALRYEWIGKEGTDSWGCKAWAVEKDTGDRLEGTAVTIKIAKDEGWYSRKGSKWQTMPGQMLMYRSASWFIRAHAPEIAMGMYTTDEIIDMEEDVEGKFVYEVEQNANTEELDIEDAEVVPEKTSEEKPIKEKKPAEKQEEKPDKKQKEEPTEPAGPDF